MGPPGFGKTAEGGNHAPFGLPEILAAEGGWPHSAGRGTDRYLAAA
jgi:hypothetical protein